MFHPNQNQNQALLGGGPRRQPQILSDATWRAIGVVFGVFCVSLLSLVLMPYLVTNGGMPVKVEKADYDVLRTLHQTNIAVERIEDAIDGTEMRVDVITLPGTTEADIGTMKTDIGSAKTSLEKIGSAIDEDNNVMRVEVTDAVLAVEVELNDTIYVKGHPEMLPLKIELNEKNHTVTVHGGAADGDGVSGHPVLVAGSHNSTTKTLKTDSEGRLDVTANAGTGTFVVGGNVDVNTSLTEEKPVLVGGEDDLGNAQNIAVDADGNVQVDVVSGSITASGNVATNESVAAEKPVLVGGEDDLGNAQNIAVDTDGNVQVDVVSGTITASGNVATNESVAAEKPVLVGGEDSLGNAQNIAVDTDGNVQVDVVSGTITANGNVATNESVAAEKPVLVGGEDSLGNVQNIAVDTDGNVQVDVVSGTITASGNVATNESVAAEKPVLVGGEDSLGNAQNIAVDSDGNVQVDIVSGAAVGDDLYITSSYRHLLNLAGTTLDNGGVLEQGYTGLVNLTDITQFAITGYIRINDEIMSYNFNNGATGNEMNIATRGVFGTKDSEHADGSNVGELYDSGIKTLDTYTQVVTKIEVDQDCGMRFIWYSDLAGTTTIRTLGPSYSAASGYDYLSAPAFGPYVRYTIAPSTGITTQDMFFETEFTRTSIHPQLFTLNSGIFGSMISQLTRSVTVGKQPDGDFVNLPADGSAFATTDDDLLSAGENYTSVWTDTDGYNAIELFVKASHISVVDGILVEFSDDIQGSQIIRGTKLYSFTAEDIAEGFKTIYLSPALDGFRVIYINGDTAQTDFYMEATCRINGNAETRAEIVGRDDSGTTRTLRVDEEGDLVTNIHDPLTSFGELRAERSSPVIQLNFIYGIIADVATSRTDTTPNGAVSTSDSLLTVDSSANANSYGEFRSLRFAKYRPGQGIVTRFTAMFPDSCGVNSTQVIGIGDDANGFFFGCNGDEFGVLQRTGGKKEIRQMTITGGADGIGGTLTVTLNGQDTTCTIQANADVYQTAAQIASEVTFADAGDGWDVYAVNSTVYFIYRSIGDLTAGSFSFATGTSGVAASTISQVAAGALATDTWTPQTSWNIDKANGLGPTRFNLDITKGNVFQIQYQWLGFGAVTYFIETTATGRFRPFHRFNYANTATVPSTIQPTGHVFARVDNADTTQRHRIQSASMAAFVEGTIRPLTPVKAATGSVTTSPVGLNDDPHELVSIQVDRIISSIELRAQINIKSISFIYAGGNNQEAIFYVRRNPTISTATQPHLFTATTNSIVSRSANANCEHDDSTAEDLVYTTGIAGSNFFVKEFRNGELVLFPGDILAVSVSGPGSTATATIIWQEDI